MMFLSLPPLPPPPSSLLPSSSPSYHAITYSSTSDNPQQTQAQHQQRQKRAQPTQPSSLAILAADEALVTRRKAAIAHFGSTWLKPAGCAKTMAGRREEELEREEMERQMREQEAMEEMEGVDMERANNQEGEDPGGMEGDLDAGLEDRDQLQGDETRLTADEEFQRRREYSIGFSSRADGDFEDFEERDDFEDFEERDDFEGDDQLARDMLDEDEQGMAERDLDGSIPDMDATGSPQDQDLSQFSQQLYDNDEGDVVGAASRDLDESIPEAHDESGEWQHTDTELSLNDTTDNDESMNMDESAISAASAMQMSVTRAEGQNRRSSGMNTRYALPQQATRNARAQRDRDRDRSSNLRSSGIISDALNTPDSVSDVLARSTSNDTGNPNPNARRNLFGGRATSGSVGVFAGTPPGQEIAQGNQAQEQGLRRSGRRAGNVRESADAAGHRVTSDGSVGGFRRRGGGARSATRDSLD